jgi:hypothetical protein
MVTQTQPATPAKSAKSAPRASAKTALIASTSPAAASPATAKRVAKKVAVKTVKTAPKVAPTLAPQTLTDKSEKSKKPKLVRDSFTIPKSEYTVLESLKQRATNLAHPVKKSETLRAGIKALAAMSDAAFLTALKAVPAIKTGRPRMESMQA